MKSFSGVAGIALIDLDDLKLYNDTFGHSAGDAALKALVQITKKGIRHTDKLIRYGGDEFLLIMPNVSSSIFAEKLRTIQEHIHEADFPEFPGLKISASIGGAMLYNGSIEDVASRADKPMYYAKSYKNTVAMDEEVEYEKAPLDAPTAKPKVLIVDDSELNRDLLKEMLRDRYEVLEAADGEKGLALLYELGTKISLVLLDVVMPKLGGFDVLAVMQKERWLDDIPVMMISSEDSPAFIQKAYDMGASDYITRPFNMNVVRQRSDNITKLYAKQRRLLSLVSSQIQEKGRNNHIIISILSEVVGLKNGESRKHILNVSRITELLLSRVMQRTSRYHLTWQDEALITNAAALHDIGKIGIDEKILNKPGKLTKEEFEIMKTHTLIGAKMVEHLEAFREEPLVKVTYAICRWHHERWDGRGYPDGLKGDAIPISAQIVSLADVYDALTSKRVYKDAFAHEKAIRMILDGECGLFNPLLLDCLLGHQRQPEGRTAEKQHRPCHPSEDHRRNHPESVTGDLLPPLILSVAYHATNPLNAKPCKEFPMNIEACYNKMGADYAEVKSRLPSDAFIKRFALKFLDDPTFALLEKNLAEENVDEAFRAAHTLKGITQNLGFSQLSPLAIEITEILRAGTMDGVDNLFPQLKEKYDMTVACIKEVDE